MAHYKVYTIHIDAHSQTYSDKIAASSPPYKFILNDISKSFNEDHVLQCSMHTYFFAWKLFHNLSVYIPKQLVLTQHCFDHCI